jgi:hypothetical protein
MKSSTGLHRGLLRGAVGLTLACSAAGVALFAPAASAQVQKGSTPHNVVMVTKAVSIPANKSTKILTLTLTLPPGELENVRAIGDGSLTNGTTRPIIVGCLIAMDGKTVGAKYTVTIGAKSSVVVPYGVWIPAVQSGRHTFTLTAKAPGALRFTGGSLLTVGLPAADPNGVLANSGANVTSPIPVGTTSFTNAARDTLATKTQTNIDVDGWIGLRNTSKSAVTVALRYGLDGRYITADYNATLPAGASQDIPITTYCPTVPSGTHVLTEQALSSSKGVVIDGGTLGGVALPPPEASSNLSEVPAAFAYGTPFTMTSGSFDTLVRVTNNSEGVVPLSSKDDSEMTGWVTAYNPTAAAMKLSLRQATDGAVETTDPTLVVTVGPHSQVSVPTGYVVCNEMPPGSNTFSVQGESSLPGLQIEVAAERATAWASPSSP